jgi:hypothetical protein
MDITRLSELKEKLLHDKDFSTIWLFFLDEFGDHQEFWRFGSQVKEHVVVDIMAQTGMRLYNQKVASVSHRLIRIEEAQFLHGSFVMHGRMGTVFYFEDVGAGLMAISDEGGETKFLRFTERQAPPGRTVPQTPPKPSTN